MLLASFPLASSKRLEKEEIMSIRCRGFRRSMTLLLLALLHFVFVATANSEVVELHWIKGPATVTLGDNIAEMNLDEQHLFANAEDTRLLLEHMGNPPDESEIGLVTSKNEDEDWFIVFSYFSIGYVRDDDADSIDANALLNSIKKATERSNKERKKKGHSALNIIGWYQEPRYDAQSHNLVWAILCEDEEGDQTVNYNTRLLGRYGFMSAVLVAGPDVVDACKPQVEKVIAGFSYKRGKTYAEWVSGDKVAEYGLTALVAGGAGAAAVKYGLLNVLVKAWKALVLAVVGFSAALWKKIKRVLNIGDATSVKYPPE
jgi:uncharacterized membrane-anchored protein